MNMRAPSVYLYDLRDGKHCLYLGDYTTSEGLRLVPTDSQILIRHIYADNTPVLPDHLVGPQSVDAIGRFVGACHSIVDFECSINSAATLSTHDDCECHFQFPDQDTCEMALRRAVPPRMTDTLWGAMLANRGRYVTINDYLNVATYSTFDDYLTTLK
jgi:hypothetical protein